MGTEDRYVVGLQGIDDTQVAVVGGKGAHLGALSRIDGIRVPPGFAVTTDAFRRVMRGAPSIDGRLDALSRLDADDRDGIRALSAEIRRTIEAAAIPDDVAAAITAALDEHAAYAVRSSATAEDLPTASFAGQQDTYLNIAGPGAILEHVSRCWASLFTERAVTYRLRSGFDHRKVSMAVVVQRMVFPDAAGILFTADPVTSNRKIASVEAGFGLGEALVSGLVNADVYTVRDGEVVAKAVGTKRLAISASPAGGTQEEAIEAERQGAAGADGCAGRAARAAGPADRSALRPPPGHRVVPSRRWLSDRPEPADHDAVSRPGGRRRGEPRLHLRRSPADDDRPHEAAGALRAPAGCDPADVRGGRKAVRRHRPAPGFAHEPRSRPGGPREGPADRRRAADHPRPRDFIPSIPDDVAAARRPAPRPPRSRPIRPSSPS